MRRTAVPPLDEQRSASGRPIAPRSPTAKGARPGESAQRTDALNVPYDKGRLKPPRARSLRRAMAADQGPLVQPNKASSTDERLPDLRAIVAATTLQSLARESLLASLARRQASAWASPPKSEKSAFRFGGNREPQLMWSLVIRHLGNSWSPPLSLFEHNARSAVTGITARAAKGAAGPP